MNDENDFAAGVGRVDSRPGRGWSSSTVVTRLSFELEYVIPTQFVGGKTKHAFSQSYLRTFVAVLATLIVALPALGLAAEGVAECFVREGKEPFLNEVSTSRYERKLFLTPDEVARYVFLTNRRDDGDRSAAIYRARPNRGSLPGDYWLTVTEAADSVRGDHQNVRVRRFDAPLPASAANVVHELWRRVLEQTRTNEDALPSAPTGVLSVVTTSGARLKAVTVSFEENSPCLAVLSVGESLIEYAKLPPSRRVEAAHKIEKDTRNLLKRVTRRR